MKNLNQYKNDSFDLKALPFYITEYIIKKKLDKPIDSEDHYEYFPKTKQELRKNIQELLDANVYDLNCIDTSEIIDMASLFDSGNYNKTLDNIDISKWDVSKVKHMSGMFAGYENFNCDLSNWDVNNVTNMAFMFYNCRNFNCDLSKWNVSNVTNMKYIFRNCSKFDSDLSNWDISNVTNMKYMFQNCENFKAKDLDKWNVSNVKNMEYMFDNCMKLKKIPSWY